MSDTFIRGGWKMEFRLAILADLAQLKKVYKNIIQDMNKQNIEIRIQDKTLMNVLN